MGGMGSSVVVVKVPFVVVSSFLGLRRVLSCSREAKWTMSGLSAGRCLAL